MPPSVRVLHVNPAPRGLFLPGRRGWFHRYVVETRPDRVGHRRRRRHGPARVPIRMIKSSETPLTATIFVSANVSRLGECGGGGAGETEDTRGEARVTIDTGDRARREGMNAVPTRVGARGVVRRSGVGNPVGGHGHRRASPGNARASSANRDRLGVVSASRDAMGQFNKVRTVEIAVERPRDGHAPSAPWLLS